MKSLKSILLSLCTIVVCSLNAASDGKDIEISLLTCAPGKDIYSIYGHNGVRVQQKELGLDMVYNYGTFDFREKGFILKFMRGKLPYTISGASYDRFLYEYNYFQRSVREQVLYLDSVEKQQIVQFLDWNMQPENKTYKYDFFRDNCATRVRDILDKHIQKLKWNPTLSSGKTFREIIKEYQHGMPWINFGIDLIIGAPADQITTLKEETFIPDYLAKAVSNAKTKDISLQKSAAEILTFNQADTSQNFLLSPWFLFLILLAVELYILFSTLSGKNLPWVRLYDKIWVTTVTLAMLLMAFMWLGTDHIPTKENYNLLWCSPFIPIIFLYKKSNRQKQWLFWLILILLLTSAANAIPGFQFLPQYFHPLIVVISMILLLKIYRWGRII